MSYWQWLKNGLHAIYNVKEWPNIVKGIVIFMTGMWSTLLSCLYLTENINAFLGLIVFIVGIFFSMTYGWYWMVKDF